MTNIFKKTWCLILRFFFVPRLSVLMIFHYGFKIFPGFLTLKLQREPYKYTKTQSHQNKRMGRVSRWINGNIKSTSGLSIYYTGFCGRDEGQKYSLWMAQLKLVTCYASNKYLRTVVQFSFASTLFPRLNCNSRVQLMDYEME